MMRAKSAFLVRLLVVIVLAVAVAFLALRTSPYLQYVSWMPRWIGVWADSNGILRNTVAFFALALLVCFLVGRGIWQVLGLCLFATAIEVAQLWVRGRVFDGQDIVASIAGILLAWPVAWAFRSRSNPR
jgi:glycopeptide antibiotics resistance protein